MSQTTNSSSSSITRSDVNFSIGQVTADRTSASLGSIVTISVPISYDNKRANGVNIQGVLNLQGDDGSIFNEEIMLPYTYFQTSKIIKFNVSSIVAHPVIYTAKVFIDIGNLTSNTVTVNYGDDGSTPPITSTSTASTSSAGCPSPCPVCPGCPACPQPVCPKPSCPSCPTCPTCPVCPIQNSTSLTSSSSPPTAQSKLSSINYTPITLIGVLIIIILLCILLYKLNMVKSKI